MNEVSGERKFLIGMLASMLCWGISWPVGKILGSYGSAESIALFRFAATFLSLLPLLLLGKEKLNIPFKTIPLLLAASSCLTLYSYLFLEGLHHGKAGAGGVLTTTLNPIITFLATILITLRKPSYKEILGLAIGALAGCVLLRIWLDLTIVFDAGNLYFVGATITWAILSKFTSLSSKHCSPVLFSLWMYGCCTLLMLSFTQLEENISILKMADGLFWLSLFFSATITTALATTFYFYATTKIGADKASSYIFLVPLSAAIGSWVLLGEQPLWNTLVGGCIGIIAVYILNKKK